MRRTPDDFGDDELELVHISRTLREAKRVEAALDGEGVEYAVTAEPYRARALFVFPTQRIGAFFWVRSPEAATSRALLASRGHQTFEAEAG